MGTERQVQAALAVLLVCISLEIAGDPFQLITNRFRILGRLEKATLFVQWATMWCGSMIYASQDRASEGFVVFLSFVVAVLNIGMLLWLGVRLLLECNQERQDENRTRRERGGDNASSTFRRKMSDLTLSVQRWRHRRMTVEEQQTRTRRRTFEATDNNATENPAMVIELTPRSSSAGEVKVVEEGNGGSRRGALNDDVVAPFMSPPPPLPTRRSSTRHVVGENSSGAYVQERDMHTNNMIQKNKSSKGSATHATM